MTSCAKRRLLHKGTGEGANFTLMLLMEGIQCPGPVELDKHQPSQQPSQPVFSVLRFTRLRDSRSWNSTGGQRLADQLGKATERGVHVSAAHVIRLPQKFKQRSLPLTKARDHSR